MKEIDADRIASYGLRHSAPSTQYQQDQHLRGYYAFIFAINDKSPDLSDEATNSLAFPANTNKLLINLRNFILFVFKRVKVRTDITNPGESGNMRYATLLGYRKSLLFWVPRMYQDLGLKPPSSKVIFQALAETMRYVQRTYGTPNQKINRSGLGLIEFRQLLECKINGMIKMNAMRKNQRDRKVKGKQERREVRQRLGGREAIQVS
ncbi:DNA polymerase V [Elsinoe australis]|uniref:DNA polymerase V n=1 Tax=Elsinoe australis TaxID=40998 RepID=A0A2P7YDY5_9PEZI|nr:DNA polymerase V [Elsinoe australis]